jgi:nucleoside-diphosphate-sugar epimerase
MATGAPDLTFAFVDVRDVAKAHILAATNDAAEGRNITVNQSKTMLAFAGIIKSQYGKKYKLPTMQTPKFMLYLVGWMFGLTWKFISKNVGYPLEFDNTKSKVSLVLEYLPLEQTVKDMVTQMENSEG